MSREVTFEDVLSSLPDDALKISLLDIARFEAEKLRKAEDRVRELEGDLGTTWRTLAERNQKNVDELLERVRELERQLADAEARLRGRVDAMSDAAYWMRRSGEANSFKAAYISTGVELTWTHAWALAANVRRERAERQLADYDGVLPEEVEQLRADHDSWKRMTERAERERDEARRDRAYSMLIRADAEAENVELRQRWIATARLRHQESPVCKDGIVFEECGDTVCMEAARAALAGRNPPAPHADDCTGCIMGTHPVLSEEERK